MRTAMSAAILVRSMQQLRVVRRALEARDRSAFSPSLCCAQQGQYEMDQYENGMHGV